MKTKPCSHQAIVGVQRLCKASWVFGVRPGWLQWLSPSYPGTKAPQSACAQLGLGRKNFYSNTGCRRVAGMRETRPWELSQPTLTLVLACRRFAFSRNRVFLRPRTPQRLYGQNQLVRGEGRVQSGGCQLVASYGDLSHSLHFAGNANRLAAGTNNVQ